MRSFWRTQPQHIHSLRASGVYTPMQPGPGEQKNNAFRKSVGTLWTDHPLSL